METPPPQGDIFRGIWTVAWFIGLLIVGSASYFVLLATGEGQCGDSLRVAGDQLDHFCSAIGFPLHGHGSRWALLYAALPLIVHAGAGTTGIIKKRALFLVAGIFAALILAGLQLWLPQTLSR